MTKPGGWTALLSNYKPDSAWSQVNQFAAERPVEVPQELFDLLAACVEYSRKSEGAFDITVGPLMKVWGFYKGTGHLPAHGEVKKALACVGYKNLILDAKTRTVRFAKKGVEIDPGGIGKGYAVDRMVEILRRAEDQDRAGIGVGKQYLCDGRAAGRTWLESKYPRPEG